MKYIIAGHNSFYLRENWLNKIFNKIFQGDINKQIDPSFFVKSKIITAIDTLGVGSAMVDSIKFWGEFFQLFTKDSEGIQLTPSGKIIFTRDKYLQNINSLWILHCNCLCKSEEVPLIWNLALENKYSTIFSRESLGERCNIFLSENSMKVSDKSLKDSINVFIKTYLFETSEDNDPEDNIVSPFVSLKYLITKDNKEFYFRNISSQEISEYIIFYILHKKLNFFQRHNKILLSELYTLMNNIIKINYTEFSKLIKKLEDSKEISVDYSANLENIIFNRTNIQEEFILSKILESENQING
ncbi:MAG: DUF4007 family protein [Cetobacterium sp.]|uniref:DUF4007 family protein n=1 Tax=Cetobacterium sp. TaxID=2071632 RepID=UPI003F3DA13F